MDGINKNDDNFDSLSSDENHDNHDVDNKLFLIAANHVQTIYNTIPRNDLLELYALYKQATIGKCNRSKPSILNLQECNKWYAWNKLGEMSSFKAKILYINKVKSLDVDWCPELTDTKIKTGWVCQSIPKTIEEPIKSDEEKTMLDFVREGNVERVKEHLQTNSVNHLTALDENGMAFIHWACDRNHVEIVRLLLTAGTPVDLKDIENQTPLHYACSCGHVECARILLEHGADPNARDKEGQSCKEVSYQDPNLQSLLSTSNT